MKIIIVEKINLFARITKMWHRGTNWTNAISSILSNLKSSMNVQQYYLKNQCTYLNFKTEKTKTIQTKKNDSNSQIKDHWSQITVTNTIIMKKWKILRELPKCDTEIQNERMLVGKRCWSTCRVVNNLQFVKISVSAECSKTRYACILKTYLNTISINAWQCNWSPL